MNDQESNKAVVRRFFDAFAVGDWATVADLCDDDLGWVTPVYGVTQSVVTPDPQLSDAPVTRSELLENLRFVKDRCVDGRFTVEVGTMTAEDDRVSVECRGHATNVANGRTYANSYHHLIRLRDGKITSVREYQDTFHLFDVWMAD